MARKTAAGVAGVVVFAGACGPDGERGGGAPLDAEAVQLGREVYLQHCASCHGLKGEGSPNPEAWEERGETPPPPHDPTGHTWRHSDALLYRIVEQGWRDPFNETQQLTMPPFRDVLSPVEIRAVITYLKTLWTPEQREFQREESRDEPFPPQVAGKRSMEEMGGSTRLGLDSGCRQAWAQCLQRA